MALFENCRVDIVEFNGLNLLGDFLNEKPSNYNKLIKNNRENNNDDDDDYDDKNGIYEEDINDSESTACERVQQKAAIAINRFAKEPQNATLLVELGGLLIF